jgi:hypothetical protein
MTTYTSPQDGTTSDAWIADNAANNNYGTDANLHIGEDNASDSGRRAIIKFPGLSNGDISSLELVDSAYLCLTQVADYCSNACTLAVYRLKLAPTYSQVTWNSRLSGTGWNTAGAFGAADCEQTNIGTLSLTATEANGLKTITLTASAIEEFIKGTWTNNGFLLKMTNDAWGQNNMYTYASTDNGTSASRPYIIVNHHTPAGYPKILILN